MPDHHARARAKLYPQVLILAAILAVACGITVPLADRETPEAVDETQQPFPSPSASAPGARPTSGIADLPSAGRLAALGSDGNLYILEHGRAPLPLTDDAIPIDRTTLSGRLYQHPTWSPDGWLSFTRAENLPNEPPGLQVLAVPPGGGVPITILETPDASYVYGYWSPAACRAAPECNRLAYLMNDGDRVALHLAEVHSGNEAAVEDAIVGRAAPFYYSWSPDGESMLWYQYDQYLSIYDLSRGEISEWLPFATGRFMAPSWSPVDDRLLFARADPGGNRVMILDGDRTVDLGLPVEGFTYFNWSPDGQQVAYTYGGDPLAPVTVINADGSNGRVLAGVRDIVAFFWSPDSTKLAIVSLVLPSEAFPQAGHSFHARPAAQPGDPGDYVFAWSVIDVVSGEAIFLTEFLPTGDQWYMLKYFDQYAQSHRVWSPDSRYIVYAEQQRESGHDTVRLLDTQRPDEPPLQLMEGTLGIFAFK